MGVEGLWRLIESSGTLVPLETLENKILAVDISIWLHQCVKGYQDSKGQSVPNSHLIGIYHRVCKLLYFRIKPIFVFDGGVPALKRQTIERRVQSKLKNEAQAGKLQRQLLSVLLKHTAVSKVLTDKIEASLTSVPKITSNKGQDDLFVLPQNTELDSTVSSSEDESEWEETSDSSPTKNYDLHTIDVNSAHFKSLPADVRHEILSDLKETRKQSSWGRIHELPKESDGFSTYQMKRLLKRQAVQTALEETTKEMGGKSLSLSELESVLKDEGILKNENIGKRIASDNVTRYVYIKDLKKALEEEKNSEKEKLEDIPETDEDLSVVSEEKQKNKADLEYEEDLQKAIALSLQEESTNSDEPSSSGINKTKKVNIAEFSFLDNFDDADFASSSSDDEEETIKNRRAKLNQVHGYMLENSGLTPMEIQRILGVNEEKRKKLKEKSSGKILEVIPEKDEHLRDNLEMNTNTSNNVAVNKDVQLILSDDSDDNTNLDRSKDSKNKNKETINDDVEFMSSSDSESEDGLNSSKLEKEESKNDKISDKSDSGIFVEDSIKRDVSGKAIEININPDDTYKEDEDLFSDIFTKKEINIGHKSLDMQTGANVEQKEPSVVSLKQTEIGFVKDNIEVNKNKDLLIDSEGSVVGVKDTTINAKPTENTDDNTIIADNSSSSAVIDENKTQINNVVVSANDKAEHNKDVEQIEPKVIANTAKKDALTEQELVKLRSELHKEKVNLLIEKSSKERIASNITEKMYQEAQDLLELFGIPYVVAPMEAEAQCAFLEEINLTDGTITDDSDIWLFGAKTVYKNFFDKDRYVKEFRASDIEHHFKLSRDQMILFALLVGSDYTDGLQGVGPVTAMEILANFPPARGIFGNFRLSHAELLSGLREFRAWYTERKSPSMGRTLKNKIKNVTFPENFPSVHVVRAYLEPNIDNSREPFSWGKPNTIELIDYAAEKFGWTRLKSEDILTRVIRRLEEVRHQKTIKDYFKTKYKIHSHEPTKDLSKRVKSALIGMGKDPSEIATNEKELKKKEKKLPTKGKKSKEPENGEEVTAPEFTKKNRTLKDTEIKEKIDNEAEEKNDTSKKRSKVDKSAPVQLKKLKSKPISNEMGNDSSQNKETNQKNDNEAPKKRSSSSRTRKSETVPKSEETSSSAMLHQEKIQPEGKNEDDIMEKNNTIRKKRPVRGASSQNNETNQKTDIEDAEKNVVPQKRSRISRVPQSDAVQKPEDPTSSAMPLQEATEPDEENEDDIITEKINIIRKRRALKEAKSSVGKKDANCRKEKAKKLIEEAITEDLAVDEEMKVLSQVLKESKEKAEKINKDAEKQFEILEGKLLESLPGPSTSTSQPPPKRPIARSTKVPKKEVIPQKEKDKSLLLRNKLKAIETFRKGKRGPGYVQKKEKRKMYPKLDAELSEDSQ
ncbi:DNA repair protein complementing XP-G cells homolog [Sitophilus oryzae]|uniref:DNA repair protein complementing XP-G cells homolog n=1 Tax=Sitophilus oryzae TaxID=7048 RepID=A0A6J2XE05_SITOR|nr:DNA repair protein complementing XP-G cells homolog [Sitophilus oryzae]